MLAIGAAERALASNVKLKVMGAEFEHYGETEEQCGEVEEASAK